MLVYIYDYRDDKELNNDSEDNRSEDSYDYDCDYDIVKDSYDYNDEDISDDIYL